MGWISKDGYMWDNGDVVHPVVSGSVTGRLHDDCTESQGCHISHRGFWVWKKLGTLLGVSYGKVGGSF